MASEPTEPHVPPRVSADVPRALQLDVDALFAKVAAETVDRRPSALERMRQWPTLARRVALGALGVLVALLTVGLQGLRPDLAEHASVLLPPLAVLLGAASLGLGRALRPLHLSPLALPWLVPALLVTACVVCATLAGWPGLPVTPEPRALAHMGCGIFTGLASTGVALGVWLLDRDAGSATWRLATGCAAGALAAFAVQTLVCPVVEPQHMILGHTAPGLLLAAAILAVLRLTRPRA